jgi:hypothetical protein
MDLVFLGFEHICSGQKLHHTLHLRVPTGVCLCVGDPGIGCGPSHPVAHEINRPFENVLTGVEEFFGLLSERKGMQGFQWKPVKVF